MSSEIRGRKAEGKGQKTALAEQFKFSNLQVGKGGLPRLFFVSCYFVSFVDRSFVYPENDPRITRTNTKCLRTSIS